MELVIVVVIAVAVVAWFIWKDRQLEQSGSHPLDAATKTPEPWPYPTSRPPENELQTTKPDGIGHESIPAIPTVAAALDVNKDGQVNSNDVVSALDINKDGKVDLKDVVAASDIVVEKTKKAAKKTKEKAVEVVEKTTKAAKRIKKT